MLHELALSPVIYVPGNHEYHGLQNRETVDGIWNALAALHPGLHYLVAENVEIDSVRFWGAWTATIGTSMARVHSCGARRNSSWRLATRGLPPAPEYQIEQVALRLRAFGRTASEDPDCLRLR